jgi:hypothetical protein
MQEVLSEFKTSFTRAQNPDLDQYDGAIERLISSLESTLDIPTEALCRYSTKHQELPDKIRFILITIAIYRDIDPSSVIKLGQEMSSVVPLNEIKEPVQELCLSLSTQESTANLAAEIGGLVMEIPQAPTPPTTPVANPELDIVEISTNHHVMNTPQ